MEFLVTVYLPKNVFTLVFTKQVEKVCTSKGSV